MVRRAIDSTTMLVRIAYQLISDTSGVVCCRMDLQMAGVGQRAAWRSRAHDGAARPHTRFPDNGKRRQDAHPTAIHTPGNGM